jgi:hypothetical protein
VAAGVGAICASAVLAWPGRPDGQAPLTLAELLFRANEAIIAYERGFAAAVAEEDYTQRIVASGGDVRRTRALLSQYMFVRGPDSDAWAGLRDVHTVDGRRLDAEPPLRDMTGPVLEVAREASRRNRDSARHYLGNVPRSLNVPTLALTFLHPLNQHRFAFEKVGEETVEGIPVWAVRFSETARPTVIRAGTGDLFARGTFWLEPAGGRVVRSQVELGDQNMRTRMQVTVTYREDPALGLFVPVRMEETYETISGRAGDRVEGTATYSDYRRIPDATRSSADGRP